MVDSCRSKLVKRGFRSASGNYFWPQVVRPVHRRSFLHNGETSITVILTTALWFAVVSSPCERVSVTEFLNRNLNRISKWYELGELNVMGLILW